LPRRLVHLFVGDSDDVDVALSSDVAAKCDRPHEVRTDEAVAEYQAQHGCDLVAERGDVIKRSHPPIIPRRVAAIYRSGTALPPRAVCSWRTSAPVAVAGCHRLRAAVGEDDLPGAELVRLARQPQHAPP